MVMVGLFEMETVPIQAERSGVDARYRRIGV